MQPVVVVIDDDDEEDPRAPNGADLATVRDQDVDREHNRNDDREEGSGGEANGGGDVASGGQAGNGESRKQPLDIKADDEDAVSCCICMEAIGVEGPHRASTLRCGHIFGKQCIETWLKMMTGEGKRCPKCKKKAKLDHLVELFDLPKVAIGDPATLKNLEQKLCNAERDKRRKEEENEKLKKELEQLKRDHAALLHERQRSHAQAGPSGSRGSGGGGMADATSQQGHWPGRDQWQQRGQPHQRQQHPGGHWQHHQHHPHQNHQNQNHQGVPQAGALPPALPWGVQASQPTQPSQAGSGYPHSTPAPAFGHAPGPGPGPSQQPTQPLQPQAQAQAQLPQVSPQPQAPPHVPSVVREPLAPLDLPPPLSQPWALDLAALLQPTRLGPVGPGEAEPEPEPDPAALQALREAAAAAEAAPRGFAQVQGFALQGGRCFGLQLQEGLLMAPDGGPRHSGLRLIPLAMPQAPARMGLPPRVSLVKEVALRPQGRGPLLAALAITCDGSGSAAGGGAGPGAKRGEVALVSANARTLVASVPVHAPVWSCAWSRRCDHTVYLGLQTGSVLCLDIRMSGPQAVRSMASLPTTQPVHSVVPLPLQLTAPAAGQPGAGEADGGQGQRALPEVLAASTAGVWGLGEGQLFPLAPQQHQAPGVTCESLALDPASGQVAVSWRAPANSNGQAAPAHHRLYRPTPTRPLPFAAVGALHGHSTGIHIARACFVPSSFGDPLLPLFAAADQGSHAPWVWSSYSGEVVCRLPSMGSPVLQLGAAQCQGTTLLVACTGSSLGVFQEVLGGGGWG